MTYAEPPFGTQLVLGTNLVRLRAVVTSAEQVPEVTVTGYDPKMSMPVIGPFPLVPSTGMSTDPATLPAAVSGEFGASPLFYASRPFDSESAATNQAKSIAASIAGALAELEGECLGNPAVLAGASISIGMAGQPFDGQYICTQARHVFEPSGGGYTTWFTVGGYQDRSMFALAGGSSALAATTRPSLVGLVIGTVVNNDDPDQLGQVQVQFPWLDASYVSAWARTVQIGASKLGSGFLWIPEVGDEVLVGFDRGNIDYPYVIGNLYNGVTQPDPPPSIEGAVANRRLASRLAHTIQFDDGPDAEGITIVTSATTQANTIKLDAQQMMITINSEGQVQIDAKEGVSVSSESQVSITTQGQLSLSGSTVSISSDGTLSIQGDSISIAGPEGAPAGSISVSGGSISLGM
jgi:uncharacterized protein involved in type VI secretion and phage assembly